MVLVSHLFMNTVLIVSLKVLLSPAGLTLYRTFDNIRKGADLSIHTFLCELDKWRKAHNGKFPEEVIIQVDGGSENANETVLALCEYLVVKRMVRSITLTRLPTGHTHEDIDACFAHIWRGMRQRIVHTVDEYVEGIKKIFNGKLETTVADVYIIPEFSKFFGGHIDKHLSNYAKEEYTQHQFKFDCVDCSADFPLGCRVMYRAYASDKIVEFVTKAPAQCLSPIGQLTGLEPHTVLVTWGPKRSSTINSNNVVVGFYLLRSIPVLDQGCLFPPKEFLKGSMEAFAATVAEAKGRFKHNDGLFIAWSDWSSTYVVPEGTTALQYATSTDHRIFYRVPFLQIFRSKEIMNPDWAIHLTAELEVGDEDFKWPEQLAAAMHSVQFSFQRMHIPCRVFQPMDTELRDRLKHYASKSEVYYSDQYLNSAKFVLDVLKDMLKQRIMDDGSSHVIGSGPKRSIVEKLKQTDKMYVTSLLRPLNAVNSQFITTLLLKPYHSIEECNSIKATSKDGTLSLTWSQIRQFNVGKLIRFEVMQFILKLFHDRFTLMKAIHERRRSEDGTSKLKEHTYLLSPANLNEIPLTTLADMYKVFIVFKLTDNINTDDWALLVVDFVRLKVYYVDVLLSGDVALTESINAKLTQYQEFVNAWMHRCNWIPVAAFPCVLYPKEEHAFEPIQNTFDSAIYITTIIDMISHECPRFFEQSDTFNLRQSICYNVLNNYFPY